MQDDGMTMAELVEVVYKLVKDQNLPFFLGSDGRFHPWKRYRWIFNSGRRPPTIEGGRAASREQVVFGEFHGVQAECIDNFSGSVINFSRRGSSFVEDQAGFHPVLLAATVTRCCVQTVRDRDPLPRG